jgi:hypothetical protein
MALRSGRKAAGQTSRTHRGSYPNRVRFMRGGDAVTDDPVTDWTTPLWGERLPRCPWVKITQLLGEVQCYLQPGHDGAHCSAEWMEWT